MSELAMALVIALKSGEGVSQEIEQCLSIDRYQNGTWQIWWNPELKMQTVSVTLEPGWVNVTPPAIIGGKPRFGCQWVDEGKGRCRMITPTGQAQKTDIWLGIYTQEGNRLIICLGNPNDGHRPKRFLADKTRSIFILQLTKPSK